YGDALLIAIFEMTAIRRAEQMRADFVANVSHELRTPLATLLGFIETLRGPAKDDAAARDRFLTIMNEQASRMARLVRDLLSLSRIEENEHTPPTAKVDIAPLLAAAGDLLAFQAQAKEIEIVCDVAPGLPAVIGDADQLAQVFQNLLDNAIKYGRPKTRVRLAAQLVRPSQPAAALRPLPTGARLVGKLSSERMIVIAVADEGEGIARDQLSRLTERFYRIDAGRSRQLGGTGLGLAIVKHIVNRHRGALAIDSEPGRGSVFTVYLPVA
ncbi:MAG TPA: ATP-binding protein, partial [Alphaproteobacteria bacterium]|nr:ATP-binding protein [Alphaproteobacteria bacterium]